MNDTNRTDVDRMVARAAVLSDNAIGIEGAALPLLDAIDLAAILAAGEEMSDWVNSERRDAWLAATAKLREGTG